MTPEQARDALRKVSLAIREAEGDYRAAVEAAANAEAVYRAKLAQAIKGYRESGTGFAEAEKLARGDVVTFSRERDDMAGRLKLAAEVIENRRDDRRSLWRVIELEARPGEGRESWAK